MVTLKSTDDKDLILKSAKNLKNNGLEYQVRSSYIYVIKNGTSLAISAKTTSNTILKNADQLVPLKLYIIFVHVVWRFFLFLYFTWAFMFIAMEVKFFFKNVQKFFKKI